MRERNHLALGTIPSGAGVANYGYGIPGTPLVSVRGVIPAFGATRYCQVNYRNALTFCTSATSNATNGVSIVWTP